jgi:hypothetical protein
LPPERLACGVSKPVQLVCRGRNDLPVAATPALSRVEIAYDERHSWRGRRYGESRGGKELLEELAVLHDGVRQRMNLSALTPAG